MKMHLAYHKPGTGRLTTECGRVVVPGMTVKIIADRNDAQKYNRVTCHFCRWGRT